MPLFPWNMINNQHMIENSHLQYRHINTQSGCDDIEMIYYACQSQLRLKSLYSKAIYQNICITTTKMICITWRALDLFRPNDAYTYMCQWNMPLARYVAKSLAAAGLTGMIYGSLSSRGRNSTTCTISELRNAKIFLCFLDWIHCDQI